MVRISQLRVCSIALVLGLVGVSRICGQTSPSQSQSSPGQESTQPTQAQQPAKSADDNGSQDQLPIPPVVAGTSTNAPITGASQPIIGLVASRSYLIPSIFFFGQLDSNANHFGSGGSTLPPLTKFMGGLASRNSGCVRP